MKTPSLGFGVLLLLWGHANGIGKLSARVGGDVAVFTDQFDQQLMAAKDKDGRVNLAAAIAKYYGTPEHPYSKNVLEEVLDFPFPITSPAYPVDDLFGKLFPSLDSGESLPIEMLLGYSFSSLLSGQSDFAVSIKWNGSEGGNKSWQLVKHNFWQLDMTGRHKELVDLLLERQAAHCIHVDVAFEKFPNIPKLTFDARKEEGEPLKFGEEFIGEAWRAMELKDWVNKVNFYSRACKRKKAGETVECQNNVDGKCFKVSCSVQPLVLTAIVRPKTSQANNKAAEGRHSTDMKPDTTQAKMRRNKNTTGKKGKKGNKGKKSGNRK